MGDSFRKIPLLCRFGRHRPVQEFNGLHACSRCIEVLVPARLTKKQLQKAAKRGALVFEQAEKALLGE